MQFDVITIFPKLFDSFLKESLIKKGLSKDLIKINIHNLREFTQDKHQQVDDRPFGGGPGMVLMLEPIYKAIEKIKKFSPEAGQLVAGRNKETNGQGSKVVLLSPTGKQFDQKLATNYSKLDRLVFICGRYEGVDARVEEFIDEKVSIGPYIVNGGELPAMIIIESVARLLPGFIGNPTSLKPEEHAKTSVVKTDLEYPVYTRPELFILPDGKQLQVPEVLLSGDHNKIKKWREEKGFDISG